MIVYGEQEGKEEKRVPTVQGSIDEELAEEGQEKNLKSTVSEIKLMNVLGQREQSV